MRLNKKIMLSALSVVLLMAMAVTAITFSLADDPVQQGTDETLVAAAGDTVATVKTNIDYIIENSRDESGDVDPCYRIVEIGSGATSPSLQAMVEDGSFKDFVINGNRTIDEEMEGADKVVYNYFKASDVKDTDEEALKIISQADFIYVSQDSNNKYSTTNDICEEVYNILHTFAVGDYKPLVIDSPNDTGIVVDPTTTITMKQLADDYFFNSGHYYYTFEWNTTWPAVGATDIENVEFFLKGDIGTASMYLPIDGSVRSSHWEKVTFGGETKNMAKFLVISSTGSSVSTTGTLGNRMFTLTGVNLEADGAYNATDEAATPLSNVYTVPAGSIMKENAYNKRFETPDCIQVQDIKLSDIESLDINFDNYDMVIIEGDCASQTISEDVYKKFVSAMYGNVHITYATGLGTGGSGGSGGSSGSTGDYNETNYSEIFYMVATGEEVARYQNIMVTDPTEFGIIATSKSAGTCKVIADVINAASYRGIGGPSSTSTMFTVLEIQPCYPVDEDLATAQNGTYYNKPSDVMTGVSKEEIPAGTEYYAWELTKAKIAHALNMDASAINLVQMSSEEFAADKTDVLGTYDLVYIGGNTSAKKPRDQYASLLELAGYDQVLTGRDGATLLANIVKLPIYDMYSHAGDLSRINLNMTGSSGGPVGSGSPMAKVAYDQWGSNTFGTLNGNDITYNGYLRLKAYVDAGMPLLVSEDVNNAFGLMIAQRANKAGDEYLQNSIDPDSNVFKFLDYCNGLADQSNICWGFMNNQVDEIPAEKDYGTSLTGSVFVCGVDARTQLYDTWKNSEKRPKLAVTSMPATYNLYDESTKLEDKTIKFKFDVSGVSNDYTVNLYIDDNGNSIFDVPGETSTENECVQTVNSTDPGFDNSPNSLSFTVPDSFSGPLYWKLELIDNESKSVVSTTSISFIKPTDESKKQVSVLQIVPGVKPASHNTYALGEGANSGYNSLYFCTVCQQAYEQLVYNPVHDAGDRLSNNALYSCNNNDNKHSADGVRNGHYMGLHEHQFGIVKYDSNLPQTDGGGNPTSTLGRDDWDQNLADEVSDLYDFDLTIMYRGEFEEISQEIYDAYAGLTPEEVTVKKAEYKAMADAYGALYDDNVEDAAEEEEELREVIQELVDQTTDEWLKSEFKRLLDEKAYWDFYNIGNNLAANNSNPNFGVTASGKDYDDYYADFVKMNDQKILNKEQYDYYMYLYYGSTWLEEAFDTIIIGPAEDFAGDDISNPYALADLKYYIEEDGQVLLFHDTLTRFSDSGSANLTKALRGYFGMDRYHMVLDTSKPGTDAGTYYLNYTLDPDIAATELNAEKKYFMMNLSYKPTTDTTRFASWLSDMQQIYSPYNQLPQKYYTNVQYTDGVLISTNTNGTYGLGKGNYLNPYKYATFWWSEAAKWNNDAGSTEVIGTNKASQNNEGIITLYPFTLSDQLNISGTHCQAYALDLESEDMTVWYSLAGGTSNEPVMSSLYAASPNDGMDSYFIYSYGNINYCGAGHAKVTGKGKDNNDERRLYINIICNSKRESVRQPVIEVFDHGTEENKLIVKDKAAGFGYIYEIDGEKIYDDPESELEGKLQGDNSYPEFTFKVTVAKETTLEYVNIYYDLDFGTSGDNKFTKDVDVMIAQWGLDTDKTVSAGKYIDVTMWDATLNRLATTDEDKYDYFKDDTGAYVSFTPTALKLDPAKDGSYFAPYGGKYTYIVIEAIDSQGNHVYQRIKIKIKDHLFNLT